MANCPGCQERLRPFGVAPAAKGLGFNHVVCPYCGTPLMIPMWVFVLPCLLTIPVAVVAHAYFGDAGATLAVLFVPGPLLLLLFAVEPYGETMLDLRSDDPKNGSDKRP